VTLRTMMMAALAVTVALGTAGCRNKLDRFRVDFIDGWKQCGGTTALCTCVFDHMAQHYGEDGLLRIEAQKTR
jgi:hypothetical protein